VSKPSSIRILSAISLFTALIAAGAFVRVPFPVVPVTLQSLVVLTAALLLKPKFSVITVGLYLFIGLAGAPIFSNGGGITYILQPTFGFLLGFLPASAVIGFLFPRTTQTIFAGFSVALVGVLIYYTFGTIYLYMILNFFSDHPFMLTGLFTLNFAITIFGDILKCLAAAYITRRLRKALPSHPSMSF
jgi:biotin transport system substrate-specific component